MIYQSNNVIVKNGAVRYAYNPSAAARSVRGIRILDCQYTTIRSVTVEVAGYVSSAIDDGLLGIHDVLVDGNRTFMNKIVGCVLTHNGVGYYRRDIWPVSAVRLNKNYNDALIQNSATDYHLYVCSTLVTKSPHNGIFFYGGEGYNSGAFWASHNRIIIDARNDGPYTGYRYGEAYGIASRRSEILKIWNNIIEVDSNYFGGNGIFIEGTQPLDIDGWSEIYDNNITASIGPFDNDGTGNSGHSTGIRIRLASKKFRIHDNTITVHSDTDPNTHYRTGLANGIWQGYDASYSPCDSIYIYNNNIEVYAFGTAEADAISFMSNEAGKVAECYNNTLRSNIHIYHFGTDGGGAYGIVSHDDTLIKTGSSAYFQTVRLGVNGVEWNSGKNIIRDGTYLNGARDKDIIIANRGAHDVTVQKRLKIGVIGYNGSPVANATVKVINGYGQTVINASSDSVGQVTAPVNYYFRSTTTGDSVNYNDFSVIVQKNNDITVQDVIVGSSMTQPVITLSQTSGSDDYVPPAQITDLSLEGFDALRRLVISWSGVGDDSLSGLVDHYEVRYANFYLNADNWSNASILATLNPPLSAGQTETMAVTLPDTTHSYFFGIIAYDEAMNPSPLSNITVFAYCPNGCQGFTGNVDNDQYDQVDIVDLLYLVEYMFAFGPPPICPMEADLDRDGIFTIADLLYFVDYMFDDGPPPGAC